MKKKISIVLGGLLAIAMLFGAASVTTAFAQDNEPSTPAAGQPGDRPDRGGKRGMGETELTAASAILGMTSSELSAALKEGRTLEDLAATAGVDIQDVKDAISAAHAVKIRADIEAGIANGSISQEKADWLLEGLDKGFLSGHGFGFDGPHGGKPGIPPTQTADQ